MNESTFSNNSTDRNNSYDNSTSTTATTTSSSLLLAYHLYASVGPGAMLVNMFILMILMSDRKLLQHSAIIFGITVSHFLNGLNIGATGIFRLLNLQTISQSTLAWNCVKLIYPNIYPFEFQCLGGLLVLAGLERWLAINAPHWFHKTWKAKFAWSMVIVVFVTVVIAMTGGWYVAWNTQKPITWACTNPSIYGKEFFAYSAFISVAGGTAAVVLTLLALRDGHRLLRKISPSSNNPHHVGRLKRHLQLTRSMTTVAVLDFWLIVVPNMLSFLGNATNLTMPSNSTYYSNTTYCINGMITIIPYLVFHKQFRKATFAFLKLNPALFCKSATAVTTMGPTTTGGLHLLTNIDKNARDDNIL